jgi:hypothetical protein
MRLTPEREKEIRENFRLYMNPSVGDLLKEVDALRSELALTRLDPSTTISWGHTGQCSSGCTCMVAMAGKQNV